MVLALVGWWAVNVPYAAIGLAAIGTDVPVNWIAAAFLPLAG
ncbi:hypothetical protein ACFC26_17475 [Kitasatospora purpeofusca]